MRQQKRIAILGAGFSGLTLAWNLKKLGMEVEIFESDTQVGGLIQTKQRQVLVETGAHALLASEAVENLFAELKLNIAEAGHLSKKKWIFRTRARNWSLSLSETVKVVFSYLLALLRGQKWPKPQETVEQWLLRIGSRQLCDFVAAPGLQGIYGSQAKDLSASLVIGGVFSKEIKPSLGSKRGSIAPVEGMSALMFSLKKNLEMQSVQFHFGSVENLSSLQSRFESVVLATSLLQASQLLEKIAPIVSEKMKSLPTVSLVATTIGFSNPTNRVRGFGCLFPKNENFHSLGVLFNTDLFENRGRLTSETWIFNGQALPLTDSEILDQIHGDRRRLSSESLKIEFSEIVRWPNVLPLYGIELEKFLEADFFVRRESALKIPALNLLKEGAQIKESNFPVYLTGNYLGGIGLSKILNYNQRLARRIHSDCED